MCDVDVQCGPCVGFGDDLSARFIARFCNYAIRAHIAHFIRTAIGVMYTYTIAAIIATVAMCGDDDKQIEVFGCKQSHKDCVLYLVGEFVRMCHACI